MPNEQVTIRTRDGECPSHVVTPEGGGPWPAIIFYMDAGGPRPAVIKMAQRLADVGYVVLLPDLFYRYGPYGCITLAIPPSYITLRQSILVARRMGLLRPFQGRIIN